LFPKYINTFLFFGVFIFFKINAQNNVPVSYLQNLPVAHNNFFHLKLGEGLEQNSITHIAQDSTGQMWFATKEGLVRYDAKKFYYYKHDIHQPNSIRGNFVERIYVAHDGSIWIGTEPAVLSKYNPETDNFNHINYLEGQRIKDIIQDDKHVYWITTDLYLYSYNEQQQKLTKYAYQQGIGLDRLLFTRNKKIWITTNEEFVLKFDPQTNRFEKHNLVTPTEKQPTRSTATYSAYLLTQDHDGYLWFTTPKGFLVRLNPENGKQKRFVFATEWENDYNKLTCMFIFEDNRNNLWFGTWFNGLYQVLYDRKHIVRYMPDENNPASISNSIVHSGFQDKAGYLWFGTEFAGMNIKKKADKFSVISNQKNTEGSLPPNEYAFAVKDVNKRFWVGTLGGGLWVSNPKNPKKFKLYKKFRNRFWVNTVYLDHDNNLWFGIDNMLIKYDSLNQSHQIYTHIADNYNSLTKGVITDIYQDQKGIFWIGTSAGLNRFDEKKQKFIRFVHDADNPNSLSNNQVRCITADKNNNIWVGTFDGLNKLNQQSGNFTVFKQDYKHPGGITGNRINDLYALNDDIWIATFEGGLNKYSLSQKKFKVYNTQNALPDNNVKAIESDQKGNLWLTTKKNIIKFDLQTGQFITYDASDGLSKKIYVKNMGWQELEFSSGFSYKDTQGYLYFGGVAGIVVFHPDSLPVNTYKPPLIIEKFEVNGKKQKIGQKTLRLNNKQNHLKFDLSVLNYIQPEKNKLAYRLTGWQDQWQYTNQNQPIEYFNLPSGTYVFEYKGSNNDGIWSQTYQTPPIIIAKAFYQTSSFHILLLSIMLSITGLFGAYRYYLKRKIRLQKQKNRYYSSNLKQNDANRISQKLQQILSEKKLYLEPDLSLHKLAESIDEKPHHVSQVINQIHGKRFHDFINMYRVEEAKKMLMETYLKIEAVAYDSGFNSLSTFNAVFKKETGMTPSQYRKLKQVE